jgi:hypothetical protein
VPNLDKERPWAILLVRPPVIGLSHLCCHNILDTVLSKQPFSDFRYTVALHFRPNNTVGVAEGNLFGAIVAVIVW